VRKHDVFTAASPVEAAGAAYWEAKADAFYMGTLRLRLQRRQLNRCTDDASKARLLAVTEELRRRGHEVLA
jgi:hypothetical protein